MPYFVVQDFKGGLNVNRLAVTGAPGTLRRLHNAHVTRGGEIEKRKAFVQYRDLPPGTYGMAVLAGVPYVFGTTANPGVPAPITYQRLVPPGGESIRRILMAQPFSGKLHVIVEWTDGSVAQYYDGAQVTAFSIGNGVENARIALPFGSKLYVASGQILFASKTGEVSFNSGDAGAGFYDMSTHAAGAEAITGLGEYQQSLAIFTRRTVQSWNFVADPGAAARQQTLPRIGTTSPRSVVSFAGIDLFFLADSGIRSLRARTGVTTAVAADVGTPIDSIVTANLRGLTAEQREAAFAEIEPTNGQYWLTLGTETYVFSYFPAAQISAWSTYSLPAQAEWMVVADDRTYIRAGNAIYLYGGEDGETYDAAQAEVELPFLDGRAIATWKEWKGLDIAAEGLWDVYAAFNPAQPDAEDLVATIDGSTFAELDQALAGFGPIVKLRLASKGSGPARIGSLVAHYEPRRAA